MGLQHSYVPLVFAAGIGIGGRGMLLLHLSLFVDFQVSVLVFGLQALGLASRYLN